MRIKEGKIGRQEGAAMVGTAVYASMIFALNSSEAYRSGNSTYLWMPAAIALGLAAALFVMDSMEKCGISTLDMLFKTAFGKTVGGVAGGVIIGLLILGAFELITDFVNMIHSFVFYDEPYWNIILWITATVGLLGFLGLECISRTARLLIPAFGIVLGLWLLLPAGSFSPGNLFPFPGNSPADMGRLILKNSPAAFAPMIAVLTITNGMHGMKFTRNSCGVGVLCALFAVAATQLCLGLTYGYKDLAQMPYPLYRLDMMMPEEGYFFRMDKIALFFWLTMGMIAAAYYIFTASMMWCRCYGPKDTRPAVLAICVITACGVQIQSEGYYEEFAYAVNRANQWGWTVILLPVLASAVQLIKKRMGRVAGA